MLSTTKNIPRISNGYLIFPYNLLSSEHSKVRTIVAYLESNQVTLPNGGHLTPSRWQQLGISFGVHGRKISPWIDLSFQGLSENNAQVVSMRFIASANLLTLVPFINIPYHLELVFRASNDLELFSKLSYKTLQLIEERQPFDGNPLYAILHEPIYCQG